MQRLQQKLSPWIALGVTGFSLFTSNYLNSLMVVPARGDSVSNTKSDRESPQSLNSMEQSVYEQINKHRELKGLPPLGLDAWLTQQARKHSEAMANGDIPFDREVLDQLNQKIIKVGSYQSAGTAIGMNLGYANPAQANVDNWRTSIYDDTRAAINGDYELTGVGVAMNVKGEYYFTQIFLLR